MNVDNAGRLKVLPGYFFSIGMDTYLRDPCPEPSLSTSTAHDLLYRAPVHAHNGHPKFGAAKGDDSKEADIGSAAHALVFGGKAVEYVESVTMRGGPNKGQAVTPKDWTTKDAQEAQDRIREAGNIPMLPHQRKQIEGIANATREALASLGFTEDGTPVNLGEPAHEVTMLWQMEGVWCRGRADYLDDFHDIDLKTVDNADPSDFLAYLPKKVGMQKALRSLGHKALGHPRKCAWLLVEREFPHAWAFVGFGSAKLAIAEERALWSARRWRRCLDEQKWPGFRKDIHWAEPKPWEEAELAERLAIK